jgi:putative endonuclease
VEVKCRHARWGDRPGDAVSWHKQKRLVRLAQHYLKSRRLDDARCRFDVVAVTVEDDGGTRVRHLPAAFDAS